MTELPVFRISRLLDAPRARVFEAWTKPKLLEQWWGAVGFPVVEAAMDFREGGYYHYCLRSEEGYELWGKFLYREISEPVRLVFISTFSDKDGGLGRHPLAPEWPQQMITTIDFEEQHDGKTLLSIQSTPYESSPGEIDIFGNGMASMTQGWTGTLNQLEAFLSK